MRARDGGIAERFVTKERGKRKKNREREREEGKNVG